MIDINFSDSFGASLDEEGQIGLIDRTYNRLILGVSYGVELDQKLDFFIRMSELEPYLE